MSCLSVSFERIGGISILRERHNGGISISAVPMEDVSIDLSFDGDDGTGKDFSCNFKREGGIIIKAEKNSGITVRTKQYDCGLGIKTVRKGGISVIAKDTRGIHTDITRAGGIDCQMYLVCTISSREPYLEISPTVVWILAGWTSNDVFSNTHWDID